MLHLHIAVYSPYLKLHKCISCSYDNHCLSAIAMHVTDHLSFKIEPIRTQSCTKLETLAGSTYYRYLYCKLVSQTETGPQVTGLPLRLTRWFASTLYCLKHKGRTVTWCCKLGTRSAVTRWLIGCIGGGTVSQLLAVNQDWILRMAAIFPICSLSLVYPTPDLSLKTRQYAVTVLTQTLNNVNKKRKSNTVRLVKRLIDSRFIAIVIIELIKAFNFLGHVVWYNTFFYNVWNWILYVHIYIGLKLIFGGVDNYG